MIDQIRTHSELQPFIRENCEENGICVSFDAGIKSEDYVIIKVDDYYNSLNENRPASPDCLIILKCKEGGYGLTIVELKNISNSQGFTTDNLIEKFQTCFDDFIPNLFGGILDREYKRVQLFFVSNIDIYKRDIGQKMETLMGRYIRFRDKKHLIRPYMPTPTIKACY